MFVRCFFLLLSFLFSTIAASAQLGEFCAEHKLSKELKMEIQSYIPVRDEIFHYVQKGLFKGQTLRKLARFVDKFGARPSGSEVLEHSIHYMSKLFADENIKDVALEAVEVPNWERGEELIIMITPREKKIAALGLGPSVSTPPKGITAQVLVVDNFEAFENYSNSEVKGKIVLFIPKFTTYEETVAYRYHGPMKAAKKGAVACLIRSITPFSINSPHTGTFNHIDVPIPAAAISLEDSELITRIYLRDQPVLLYMFMNSTFGNSISRNTIADLKGRSQPEKLVIVSGHIDSWDVGQGAMDDGGGMMIAFATLAVMQRLELQPKRTVRAVLWTAAEMGLIGAKAYEFRHRNESNNINFILESDEGTFTPLGLQVVATDKAKCIIWEILQLFEPYNCSQLVVTEQANSDISVIVGTGTGVPGAMLLNDNERYYWFHHTEGDTLEVQTSEALDLCTAFWTTLTYIIADLSVDIPRLK